MIEGSEVEEVRLPQQSWRDLSSTERRNLAMLFVLYTIQALPLGLVSGTLPLLLKSTVSYSELGVLSLCYYPFRFLAPSLSRCNLCFSLSLDVVQLGTSRSDFSLKLLWSPVVDAVYSTRIGRRKTWIIATQLVMAVVFLLAANYVQEAVTSPSVDIQKLTAIFFLLVLLAATQESPFSSRVLARDLPLCSSSSFSLYSFWLFLDCRTSPWMVCMMPPVPLARAS
eukprot:m.390502 g.390502  ORF g.390502 m.390502 type:complete len:225 (+) comp56342_c0_seq19:201-875(+)